MIRIIKVMILFLILSLFGEITVHAQDNLKVMDFCEANTVALEALNKGDHAKALEYFTMAESISSTSGSQNNKLVAAVNFGTFYSEIHSLGDALKYYNKALDVITKNPEFERHRSNVLINIGSLYAGEEEFKMSLEYNHKAYDLAVKDGTCTNCIVVSAENIADCYNNLGNYAQARKYLDNIKGLEMENMKRQAWKINYADSYLREGRIGEAEEMMKGVLENVDSNTDNIYYMAVVELLSQINQKKGDIKNALHFAADGLKNSRSIKHTADMYKLLSGIYYQDKQYEKAIKYKDSLLIVRDSISRSINSSLYSTNKVKLRIQDYQTEAKHNKEKQESERNLFILIILLGIILFYFIFRSLRNRIIKQKQLNTIADNKERIYQLELSKLSNDIAEKNKKLSAKALYMSGRNELIQEVIKSLDQIPDIRQASVHNHMKTLKQHLKADEDWDNFIAYFEQVNPNFLKSLQAKHPQLNAADIRFICYLYMNLDLKEIASILSITIEASRKRKQRIAKKMDVDIDNLNYYIMKLG